MNDARALVLEQAAARASMQARQADRSADFAKAEFEQYESRRRLAEREEYENLKRKYSTLLASSVEPKTKKLKRPPEHSNFRSLASCGFTVERRVVDPVTQAESVQDVTQERLNAA